MPSGISVDFNRDATNDILHKPEYLYAYTDPNVTGTTYYAWYDTSGDNLCWYTLSEIPAAGDQLYDYRNGTIEALIPEYNAIQTYDDSTTPPRIRIWTLGDTYWAYRDSSKDIISQPPATLYTDSTTLTTGMTLYDDTGTDTGHKVGAISGDSFDIQTETVTTYYAWTCTSTYNLANEPIPDNYTGNVYTTTETPDANSVIYDGVNSTIPFISFSGTILSCGDTSNIFNILFNCTRSSNDDITDLNNGNFLSNMPDVTK